MTQKTSSQIIDHGLPPVFPSISLGDPSVTVDQRHKRKLRNITLSVSTIRQLGACFSIAFALGMFVGSNELREGAYITIACIFHGFALAISVLLDATIRNSAFFQHMIDSVIVYILYKLIDTSLHTLKRWRGRSKKGK